MTKTLFNLPSKVIFCKECVMSNQRPSSIPEFMHTPERKNASYLNIEDGICDACKQNKIKQKINWDKREKQLLKLLDRHRSNNDNYDCVVPGSGGKDSVFASHILKYKYGMNPLTVTWPPILYTDYGYKNYLSWIDKGGFDNIMYRPNIKVQKILTRLSILNLMHPFQTFILGQKNLAPKIADKFGIKLVFFGENEAEYGNPIADNTKSIRKKSFYSASNLNSLYLSGVKVSELIKNHNITMKDLMLFLPINEDDIKTKNMQIHYLGYYLKWIPQEAYYYAVENTNFKARPFRTEGTYSKYNSIDDKIDDLHYYTTYIKFGLGRASYDASQEIRNQHITREEGVRLVKKFDGEFPNRYFDEILEYLEIEKEKFFQVLDKFRSKHLWKKNNNDEWILKNSVF